MTATIPRPAPAPSQAPPLRLSLVPGYTLSSAGDDLSLSSPLGALPLGRSTPGLRAAAEALTCGDATLDDLAELVLRFDGAPALTRLYLVAQQLTAFGALQRTAVDGAGPLATLRPVGVGFRYAPRSFDPSTPLLLSRFALLRRDGADWLLDVPLGHAAVVLHDPRATLLIAELSRPHHPGELVGVGGLDDAAVAALLHLLLASEALTELRDGEPAEDADPTRALWSVHDLLFHARGRFGRHAGPFGATFRHLDRFPPLPAVKPAPPGETIDLPRPDLAAVVAADPPLTTAIEGRRSMYPDPCAALTLAQLGEFLFRVGRVREFGEMTAVAADGRTGTMEVSSRPYPAGGRTYELELYLSVDRVGGLASGLYWYDPLAHRLVRLRERDRLVDDLLRYAAIAAPGSAAPVVIHLAARFGRVSWKYDAIAYATILKHVGVLYQTMYLVATAMGLAPCALGSGNADLFAAAAGTDYLAESSVGDFLLGARPTTGGA